MSAAGVKGDTTQREAERRQKGEEEKDDEGKEREERGKGV